MKFPVFDNNKVHVRDFELYLGPKPGIYAVIVRDSTPYQTALFSHIYCVDMNPPIRIEGALEEMQKHAKNFGERILFATHLPWPCWFAERIWAVNRFDNEPDGELHKIEYGRIRYGDILTAFGATSLFGKGYTNYQDRL